MIFHPKHEFRILAAFLDRDQQQNLYQINVQNFKIIHQILLMLCKINAKYERNIFIKL